MKCDEPKYERLGDANEIYPASTLVIRKQFVDAAIDQLKQKLHDAEMKADLAECANTEYRADIAALKADNERLNAENERLVKCCKEYDSRQRIDERIKFNGAKQLRATKHALWISRALALSRFDVDKYIYNHLMSKYWKDGDEIFNLACKAMQNKINKAKEILLKKAEEYK